MSTDLLVDAVTSVGENREELPEILGELSLTGHFQRDIPVLKQSSRCASASCAAATAATILLRRLIPSGEVPPRSPWMVQSAAQRFCGDRHHEVPVAAVLRAWSTIGICSNHLWPDEEGVARGHIIDLVARDAARCRLGQMQRINPRRPSDMLQALRDCGVLLATARIHDGWRSAGVSGIISGGHQGGSLHTFVIVGADAEGFWVQNSWGERWGRWGLGRIGYSDWLENGREVWRVTLTDSYWPGRETSLGVERDAEWARLRPHVISISTKGQLEKTGTYATTAYDVEEIVYEDIPRLLRGHTSKKILLIFPPADASHDGLTAELAATVDAMLCRGTYPIMVLWRTERGLDTCTCEASHPEAPFMGDMLKVWESERWTHVERCGEAAAFGGGIYQLIEHLAVLVEHDPMVKIHAMSLGNGAFVLEQVLLAMATDESVWRQPLKLRSCMFWAPSPCACRHIMERLGRTIHRLRIPRTRVVPARCPSKFDKEAPFEWLFVGNDSRHGEHWRREQSSIQTGMAEAICRSIGGGHSWPGVSDLVPEG